MTLVDLPDTSGGPVYRASSLHYFPGGIESDSTHTAVQNAKRYAAQMVLVIGNILMNPSTGAITTDKYNGLADDMVAANPTIKLGGYNKSTQISEGASYYPNNYYAHNCPFPSGAKVNIFNNSIYIAQPNIAAGQASFTDPRGWTAHTFKEQRARDAYAVMAAYNTKYGNPLTAVHLDSMGAGTMKTQCDPDTGLQYAKEAGGDQLWLDRVWEIGDEAVSRRPHANTLIIGNGLSSAKNYFPVTSTSIAHLLDHVDMGIAENWFHRNYTGTGFGSFAEQDYVDAMNIFIDAENRGGGIWAVVNIGNNTAGSPPTGQTQAQFMSQWTTARLDQWKKLTTAMYLIGRRSASVYEFCSQTSVKPYDEDHPYWHVDLGASLDGSGATLLTTASKSGGCYHRRYANAIVLVNPSSTAQAGPAADRDYKPITGAGDGSANVLTGGHFNVPANSGLVMLTIAGGTNAGPPVVTITAPTGSVTNPSQLAQGSVTDPDGIASVEINLNGGGWNPATYHAGSGTWDAPVTLTPGVNTIQARATDANTSPLTSSPVSHTVTLLANSGPPSVTVISPVDGSSQAGAACPMEMAASDPDGVSSVEYQLNGSAWAPLTLDIASGHYKGSATLASGLNTFQFRATDAFPGAPQTSPGVPVLVTLTTTPPPPPPPDPPPTPLPALGVGTYTVRVLTRGGGQVVMELPWADDLAWSRKGRDVSTASVVIRGTDALEACGDLANIHAWQHEIAILRNITGKASSQVWCGPITSIVSSPSGEKITITAQDLGVWMGERKLRTAHHYPAPGTDASLIAAAFAADALAADQSPNIKLGRMPASGVMAIEDVTPDQHQMWGDAMKRLVADGLYYHFNNRYLTVVNLRRPAAIVTQLVDEHFQVTPDDTEDGLGLSNDIGVRGQGGGQTDTIYGEADGPDSITSYGLHERVDSTEATSNSEANSDAAAALADSKDLNTVLSGCQLSAVAPISMVSLKPGARVTVILSKRCRAVSGTYTIDQVSVTAKSDGSEQIGVTFL